jgi:hypothetical protein
MSDDITITCLPTFCNVDKMGLKEVREQYKLLQADSIRQGIQLSEVSTKLHQMNRAALNLDATLCALVDSYEAGDQAAILLHLKNMAEHRNAKKARRH